jgi:hypothetical protein
MVFVDQLGFYTDKSLLRPFRASVHAGVPGAYAPGCILAADSRLTLELYLPAIARSTSSAVCGKLPVKLINLPSGFT